MIRKRVRFHHTKTKGDLGVAHAELDLLEKGFLILYPRTEHAPFDLVAYDGKRFYRVSVKYRSAVNGVIALTFRSIWADRHGAHFVQMDKADIDVICVYCPDTKLCYYVDPRAFRRNVALRIDPTKNDNSKLVHFARDFRQFPVLE